MGRPVDVLFDADFVRALARVGRDVPSGTQLYRVPVTRDRKVPLKFPDIEQKGAEITFRPAEMPTVAGDEIELE